MSAPTMARHSSCLSPDTRLQCYSKALAADPNFLSEAKKYLLEMVGKGMKPTPSSYTAVFKLLAIADKAKEGKEFMEELKPKGFVADEKAVREELQRGIVATSVISVLFGKQIAQVQRGKWKCL